MNAVKNRTMLEVKQATHILNPLVTASAVNNKLDKVTQNGVDIMTTKSSPRSPLRSDLEIQDNCDGLKNSPSTLVLLKSAGSGDDSANESMRCDTPPKADDKVVLTSPNSPEQNGKPRYYMYKF